MNKKISFVVTLSVLTLVIGSLFLLTWRTVQVPLRRKALFNAIRADKPSEVIALLHAGVDPNIRQPNPSHAIQARGPGIIAGPAGNSPEGTPPLLAALYISEKTSNNMQVSRYNPHPDPILIRALLEAGADANAMDQNMTPPLFYAVCSGNIEVVSLLLKHGAKVNQNGLMAPPLLAAASQGRVEMMQYLLAQGADIDAVDSSGDTALIYAIRYAHQVEPVQLLLDHHIQVNAKDRQGKTALFYAQNPFPNRTPAQKNSLPEIITLLKKAGVQ